MDDDEFEGLMECADMRARFTRCTDHNPDALDVGHDWQKWPPHRVMEHLSRCTDCFDWKIGNARALLGHPAIEAVEVPAACTAPQLGFLLKLWQSVGKDRDEAFQSCVERVALLQHIPECSGCTTKALLGG